MSCKSAIYAANTASQDVSANGVINFGSVVRRFGQNCNLSGGNVVVDGSGYYDVDVNINFLGSATDTATFTVFKDGTAIPGASATVTTAASTAGTVTIPAVIREICCCESTITVGCDIAITVSNAAIVVKKV